MFFFFHSSSIRVSDRRFDSTRSAKNYYFEEILGNRSFPPSRIIDSKQNVANAFDGMPQRAVWKYEYPESVRTLLVKRSYFDSIFFTFNQSFQRLADVY